MIDKKLSELVAKRSKIAAGGGGVRAFTGPDAVRSFL
jgi:hypothetical protein